MTRAAARPRIDEGYRAFLERRAALEKETTPQFTLARLAAQLGLSASALSMILSGKRNLQMPAVLKLAKALQWSERDTALYEALVRRDDATTEEERAYYDARARRLASREGNATGAPDEGTSTTGTISDGLVDAPHSDRHVNVNLPSASLLDKWFYPAVVVYLLDAQGGTSVAFESLSQDVAARFGIPPSEAASILSHMKELGLLELAEEAGKGRLHLHLSRLTHSMSERRHIKAVLTEAERIVDARYKSPECFFTAAAFSLPQDAVPAVVASYKTWLDGIASSHAEGPMKARRVFQSAFAFFPVTEPEGPGEDGAR